MKRSLHEALKITKTRFLAPEIYMRGNQEAIKKAKCVEFKPQARWNIRAATVLMSGCKDTEYSYDAWFNGRANGAFTYLALKALDNLNADATYEDWYKAIREYLPHVQYPQTPQILAARYQKKTWKVFAE